MIKNKGKEVKRFDRAFEQFGREKDPFLHRWAIKTLLSQVDLEEEFALFLNKKGSVKNFFLLWERAGREEKDPKEREALKELGGLSEELYERKDYQGLCELFYNIALRHLANFIRLEERKDFEEITDHDLYEKQLIPSEIFLQFFLIETLAKQKDFDWDRGKEIANHNLACLIICFGDLYEFFHEEGN